MKRKARVIKRNDRGTRAIAVDREAEEKILAFLQKDDRTFNKFQDICNLLLEGHRNSELYDKEEPDKKSKGVRAMKFFKGQENARIYCKELTTSDKTFIVIMACHHPSKKSQKLTNKELNLIKKVADYEYAEERIEEGS